MAIQMRRGQKADFDPTKMLPGEWAVSIDSDTTKQWVWMCFAPGVVKRMAAFEDIEWVLSDEFAKSSVICDVELDSTATKAYAVGDFLMLHGVLYQVTSPIAIGDDIEAGTNVTSTTVMSKLEGKQDALTFDSTPTENSTNPVTSGGVYSKIHDVEGDVDLVELDMMFAQEDIEDLQGDVSDLNQALGNKVDKVAGKGLSTEDYTTAEKTKLGALPDAATLNADLANKQSLLQVTQSISGGYLYNNYYSVS